MHISDDRRQRGLFMKTQHWLRCNAIEFRLKQVVRRLPILGWMARAIYRAVRPQPTSFSHSTHYWVNRYRSGGNSGPGSYNHLARFKAEIVNGFVREQKIDSVIEFGCGDGSQLMLASYPRYLGLDVSPDAIRLCKSVFADDRSKRFQLLEHYRSETAQLTLSLDVIYHLVEEEMFVSHMRQLFDSAERFVIIYSSSTDMPADGSHVRHRRFSRWVDEHRRDWKLMRHIPNRYPLRAGVEEGSLAEFFVYQKKPSA